MRNHLLKTTGILLAILLLNVVPIQAQENPIQLSLFNPIQLFSEGTSVKGIRLNLLYGKNEGVTGLDWGLVNHTTTGVSKGVQFGLVGYSEDSFMGWQSNTINYVENDFEGFQSGFVNYAGHANGFQLGFVNYAVTMKGLQIGLINIIKQGGQFPVFPIINWSF